MVCLLFEPRRTTVGILTKEIYLGVGAFSSPLIATQFAQRSHWSFHYLVLLGIALSNTFSLIAVFRFKDQDSQYTPLFTLYP